MILHLLDLKSEQIPKKTLKSEGFGPTPHPPYWISNYTLGFTFSTDLNPYGFTYANRASGCKSLKIFKKCRKKK